MGYKRGILVGKLHFGPWSHARVEAASLSPEQRYLILFGEPCVRLREFVRRKNFHRCAPDSCSRKGQRLHFPARVRHDSDFRDLATVREQKIKIIPIGASFPALEIFADYEKTRFRAGVDFAG